MVKHTQTIHRQQPTNCLSVFDHFVGVALKGLNTPLKVMQYLLQKDVVFLFQISSTNAK